MGTRPTCTRVRGGAVEAKARICFTIVCWLAQFQEQNFRVEGFVGRQVENDAEKLDCPQVLCVRAHHNVVRVGARGEVGNMYP